MSSRRQALGTCSACALALLAFLAASRAQAQGQGTGALIGTVVDASTHAPLNDVVVTASGPQLQGEQVSLTDATGLYRISQLPPGSYAVHYAKETFKPHSRSAIALDADRTLRLNVELLPEGLKGEEVLVVGKPPVIDVGTTQTGLTVTSAFAQSVPLSPATPGNGGTRNFSGLALVVPQVQADQFGISIAGTTSPENAYVVDGLSFSDTGYGVNNRNQTALNFGLPACCSTAGSDFSVEFIDQVNVLTGGYMPEYGRTTGGVLSVTTKSGGNEFHGSVFATWTPGFLAQTSAQVTSLSSITGASAKLYNAWDVGFTLGGYIIKDRLWFFVGFNPSQYKTEFTRTVSPFVLDNNGNVVGQTPVPSATRDYYQTQTNYSYIGKVTYLINSDNRISLAIAGMPDNYTFPYASGPNGEPTAESRAGNDNTVDAILRLSSSFLEKAVLLDVIVGWHHQNNNTTAIDGTSFNQSGDAAIPLVFQEQSINIERFSGDPAHNDSNLAAICNRPNGDALCPVSGYAQGGSGGLRSVAEDRIQGKAVMTYFLNAVGHQTLKAGVDIEWISYENQLGYSGEHLYLGFGPNPNAPGTYLDIANGYLASPDNPIFVPYYNNRTSAILPGAFIQDSWNVLDKVTLNVGVRVDAEYIYNGQGQMALALNNQWAPRIGVIWDPTYQGKSKVYASYAWYYEAVPLDLADRSLTGQSQVNAAHLNCANPAVSRAACGTSPMNLVGGGAGPNQYWSFTFADKELLTSDIAPQKTDELSVGAEYEIFPNARLGVNYTHRGLSRLIEDYSNNQATTYVLGNPGYGIASNLPTPARIYNAYTVALTKTFADHWQAQASYTYITLNGNVDGLTAPGMLDPNINAWFDLPQLIINSFGPLAADEQHRVKVYGSYQFVFAANIGLTIGGAYNGHSGAPISALGGDLLYGGDAVFIIPRGSYGRLPWVNQIDLHATVDIGLGRETVLSLGADCFNVLGSQQTTAVDQSWVIPSQTPVKPIPNGTVADLQHITDPHGNSIPPSYFNPNFGHATAFQAPRNFRLLARFTF